MKKAKTQKTVASAGMAEELKNARAQKSILPGDADRSLKNARVQETVTSGDWNGNLEIAKAQKAVVSGGEEGNHGIMTGNTAKTSITYRDRVFRMIYKDKAEFLELYNAMNDSSYDNPEDLVVTTLENAIYIGMKNDVSYLLYDQLALYEHQSTDNPNMPLRNLFYVANIYSNLVKNENLYNTKLVKIPAPQFVVFYNGTTPKPEQFELRLSDAFERGEGEHKEAALELITKVLNINFGYNQELMEKCKTLKEYSIFVNKVRLYSELLPFAQAIEKAVDECITEGILEEFLRKNRAEVINVSIFEYDEELHMRLERQDAKEEGLMEGEYLTLIRQTRKMIPNGRIAEEIAELLDADLDLIQHILALIKTHPDATNEMIYELLTGANDTQ
jgi:hypothetical protein